MKVFKYTQLKNVVFHEKMYSKGMTKPCLNVEIIGNTKAVYREVSCEGKIPHLHSEGTRRNGGYPQRWFSQFSFLFKEVPRNKIQISHDGFLPNLCLPFIRDHLPVPLDADM